METLYTALEGGLTLIHPFMPFLTEELWQRLPRRANDTCPSIVLASYPQYDAKMDSPESEAAYELILDCSKGVRSLFSEYAVKEDGRAFVHALDETSYKTASSEQTAIRSLAGKGLASLEVLRPDAPKPKGCAVFPVSAHAAVYVHVQGRIDIDAEIEKAQGRLEKASSGVAKQKKILDTLNSNVVSAAVMEMEKNKLKDQESEVRTLEEAIGQFHALKLEA